MGVAHNHDFNYTLLGLWMLSWLWPTPNDRQDAILSFSIYHFQQKGASFRPKPSTVPPSEDALLPGTQRFPKFPYSHLDHLLPSNIPTHTQYPVSKSKEISLFKSKIFFFLFFQPKIQNILIYFQRKYLRSNKKNPSQFCLNFVLISIHCIQFSGQILSQVQLKFQAHPVSL